VSENSFLGAFDKAWLKQGSSFVEKNVFNQVRAEAQGKKAIAHTLSNRSICKFVSCGSAC
jgi:hypothetical protein